MRGLSGICKYIPYLELGIKYDLYTICFEIYGGEGSTKTLTAIVRLIFHLSNTVFIMAAYFIGIRYAVLSIRKRVGDYFNSRTPEEKQSDLTYKEFLEKQKEDRRIRKFMDTLALKNKL